MPTTEPTGAPGEGGGRRRRRRRRGRRGGNGGGEAHAQHPHHDALPEGSGEAPVETFGDMSPDDLAEETGETVITNRSEPHHEGEGRRRRRRGRRGGRRNRHDREHESAQSAYERDNFEPQQVQETTRELTVPPAAEPSLREAVADLDAAPPFSAPPEPPGQAEPRRRSTVREPAPVVTSDSENPPSRQQPVQPPAPAPQPVIITEVGEGGETDKPRRSGWWSRRMAGG